MTTGDAAVQPVVRMDGISVAFPGVLALDDVHLELRSGEVHALMGGNGAGKSTLIKALTGVHAVRTGEIRVGGVLRRIIGPAQAAAAGIAVAYQDAFLCGNLDVGENVMLGHEVRRRLGIDWAATRERAAEVLAELGLGELDPRARLASLPIATRQLVAIGRAVVTRPRVLVLDEPTSSLDEAEVARLFAVLRRLRDAGVAVLIVSHFLEQVYAISDRMTVLRDGRGQGTYRTTELDRSELIALMLGTDLQALKAIGSERRAHRHDPRGAPLYRARGLGRRGALAPTDLELHPGEVVGVAGLRGSGRTELARLVAGVDRADSGGVQLEGRAVTLPSPAAALRRRIAFASEDRRSEGIVGDLSVRSNILLALQSVRGWARPISHAERDELVERQADAVRLRGADLDAPTRTLSDGDQQKVLLARWLATRPRLLVLDEPTRGVDVAAKVDIQSRVAELARGGVAVVYISSELEEVVRLSDRIVVMKDRAKIGEVSNGPAVNADSIVELIAADRDGPG